MWPVPQQEQVAVLFPHRLQHARGVVRISHCWLNLQLTLAGSSKPLLFHSGSLLFSVLFYSVAHSHPQVGWRSRGQAPTPYPKMSFVLFSFCAFSSRSDTCHVFGKVLFITHFVIRSINLMEGELGRGGGCLLGIIRDKKIPWLIFQQYCLLLLWNSNIQKSTENNIIKVHVPITQLQ